MNSTNCDVYRKCTTCLAATGHPCKALSSTVQNGQPDRHEYTLDTPHAGRPLRAPRFHYMGAAHQARGCPHCALAEQVREELRRCQARADA
jgi:hypothetical protein